MGILSGFKKVIRYIKLPDGYKKLSFWTSSQSVEMNDGSTLESNKLKWDDKYTKNEIDNKFSTLETNIDWKESVDTFEDIEETYPDPQDGWTVNVKDTNYTYRYSGEEWVPISANAIPKATQSVDGLLSKEDKTSYDSAVEKKHEHNNKSALDMITSEKIAGWDETSKTSVSGVKGNAEEKYRSGNVNITPANIGAVDKSGDIMTGTLTAPTFSGDLEGTFHGWSDKKISIGNLEYGWNARGYSSDLNTWIDPGTYMSAGSGQCTNYPPTTDGWGNISVFPSGQGRVVQIFNAWNSGDELYYRSQNGDTWSSWKLMSNHSYAMCTNLPTTVAKTATSNNFCLRQYHRMTVYFVNGSDVVTNPTLQVNGDAARRIYYKGGSFNKVIPAGAFIDMIYVDGAYYVLGGVEDIPLASSSKRGGVKTGYTANGKNYPVQLSNEQMYVNVPWTDTNTTYSVATTSANGLMSSGDKSKLDGIGSTLAKNGSFTITSSARDSYINGTGFTIPANTIYIVMLRATFNAVGSGGGGHCRLGLYNNTTSTSIGTVSNNDTGWCGLFQSWIIGGGSSGAAMVPRFSAEFNTRTGSYYIYAIRVK